MQRIVQWLSEGPAGPATGARRAEGARQEVVAVTPWPGAQTSCLWEGGPKLVTSLLKSLYMFQFRPVVKRTWTQIDKFQEQAEKIIHCTENNGRHSEI